MIPLIKRQRKRKIYLLFDSSNNFEVLL